MAPSSGFRLHLLGSGVAKADQPSATDNDLSVALVAVQVSEELIPSRTAIVAQAERGLRAAGVPLRPVRNTIASPRGQFAQCRDTACLRSLADVLDVKYVVRVDIESSPQSFVIKTIVVRASDGATMADESLTCAAADPCEPVPQSTATVTREAGRKALHEIQLGESKALEALDPNGPQDNPASDPSLGIGVKTVQPAQKPWWPWVAAGSAAALATVGTIVLLNDASDEHCQMGICPRARETTMAGWAWMGAAVAAGGVGVWGFFGGTSESGESNDGVVLSLTPFGAALGGRF